MSKRAYGEQYAPDAVFTVGIEHPCPRCWREGKRIVRLSYWPDRPDVYGCACGHTWQADGCEYMPPGRIMLAEGAEPRCPTCGERVVPGRSCQTCSREAAAERDAQAP